MSKPTSPGGWRICNDPVDQAPARLGVSATQLANAAEVDTAVAVMALRLLGAHREAGLWTTWDREIVNPLQVVPASLFTGLQQG